MRASDTEVLTPGSAAQAVEAFGDGRGITVFAGGTILMPEIAAGRYPRGGRTLMLNRAGLDQLDQLAGDSTVAIGAMVPLSKLAGSRIEPLAAAAREVGDLEIRAQATIGGNLCAPPAAESPRGDLQAALLAMGARVRSAGPGGERTESVEDFLARPEDETRLVLAIEVDKPRRGSYLSLRRPHAHSYAALTVACAQNDGNGGVRIAAGGVAPRAKRLHGVERALAEGASREDATARALDEVDPQDDALASAWYRRNVLPTLVTRALEQLQGG